MKTSENVLSDIDMFREIPIFANLKPWQADEVYGAVESLQVKKGQTLFERGTDDGYTYFITEGSIEMSPEDDKVKYIDVGKNDVLTPISNLRPRLFTVRAKKELLGFRVPDSVFSTFNQSTLGTESLDIELENAEDAEIHDFTSKLSMQLYRDLKEDRFQLPTLPDLAIRIRHAIDDDTKDAPAIAKLIEADPAISAKIVATANSALYGGRAKTESCAAAVTRLGVNTTQQLVISYSMKEVFKPSVPGLKLQMKQLWKHSSNIAALSYVLAGRVKGHDPEEALLAGLLHDLGAIAAINYIAGITDVNELKIDTSLVVNQLKGELGGMILHHWEFSPEHIAAARSAEDWLRTHDGGADLADIVVVAQFHQAIVDKKVATLPDFKDISALNRVLGEGVSPDSSIEILREARGKIDQMVALLA